jgi:two-component system phosphate regulon sensor histidine kinase PhoR
MADKRPVPFKSALAAIRWRGRARAPGREIVGATAPAPAGAAALPLARILDRFPDPLLIVSAGDRAEPNARRFLFANVAAKALLRLQRDEGPLSTAIRTPEILSAVEEAVLAGETGAADYLSGGVQDRVWRARIEPLEDGDGGVRLALITLRDETEIRRNEHTRADFLANASHELRTPLASLTGFIETLQGHARDDAEARDRFLAIMHDQAARMRRLIDDLMSLSRIELGEHIPPSGAVDLAATVIDVIDALGPVAGDRRVSLKTSLPAAGVAMVIGDRDQILQVIQNLAENALKFSPPGSAVAIGLDVALTGEECASSRVLDGPHLALLRPDHAENRRYVALSVRDWGPGIARANLPRLTERFYRIEGQKSGRPGAGLGLAIVKHIVNRHRGGLTVESREGVGARFLAYFPMGLEREQPPA